MSDYKPNLTIEVVQPSAEQNYQVITFNGDFDKAGLAEVKDRLEQAVDNLKKGYLLFDFKDLNFINSECIGFLMSLHSHMIKEKKVLVLVNAKNHVKDVFEVIGILNVIEYADSVEAFTKKSHS